MVAAYATKFAQNQDNVQPARLDFVLNAISKKKSSSQVVLIKTVKDTNVLESLSRKKKYCKVLE